jgi:hypothetical protein
MLADPCLQVRAEHAEVAWRVLAGREAVERDEQVGNELARGAHPGSIGW